MGMMAKKEIGAARHGKKFVGSCQGWLKMQLLKKQHMEENPR